MYGGIIEGKKKTKESHLANKVTAKSPERTRRLESDQKTKRKKKKRQMMNHPKIAGTDANTGEYSSGLVSLAVQDGK